MDEQERQPLLHTESGAADTPLDSQHQQTINTDVAHSPPVGWPAFRDELVLKLTAVVLNFLITGLSASAIGAMIPDIEAFYDLKNGPTAFIFPAQLAGYLTAVGAIQSIHYRFGRRGIALFGPLCRILGASMLFCGSPFPIALAAYFVFGLGTGMTDAGLCAWGSSVPYTNVVQGVIHGAWSTGCVAGPVAAALVLHKWHIWYRFYGLLV